MPGGLIQLIAIGEQDTYLTKQPEITFLKQFIEGIPILQLKHMKKYLLMVLDLIKGSPVIFKDMVICCQMFVYK